MQPISRARFFRSALFVTLGAASALGYVPACSSTSDAPSNSPTADVLRVGGVTQPALAQVLSTEADDWGWAGGVFDAPAADPTATSAATVPANVPYTFAWHADETPSGEAGAAGVGNVPSASGFTGQAYLLVFSTPGNDKLLRVFTTEASFTPDASAWKSLIHAGNPITVSLITATFEDDALTAEGGPHQGQKLTLTIDGT